LRSPPLTLALSPCIFQIVLLGGARGPERGGSVANQPVPSRVYQQAANFSFLKIFQFPSKYADCGVAVLFVMSIISNIHGAILVFTGFFLADPLLTAEK
jgi:hypothetical protein